AKRNFYLGSHILVAFSGALFRNRKRFTIEDRCLITFALVRQDRGGRACCCPQFTLPTQGAALSHQFLRDCHAFFVRGKGLSKISLLPEDGAHFGIGDRQTILAILVARSRSGETLSDCKAVAIGLKRFVIFSPLPE